jgi:GT2 family glycosyltransferase
MIVRRKVIERIGYLDPSFPQAQDTEYANRAKLNGIDIYYSPNIIVYHKIQNDKLTKKYHYKFSWKRGISYPKIEKDLYRNGNSYRVPKWIYRAIVRNILLWFKYLALGKKKKSFKCEKDLAFHLGTIVGILKLKLNKF